MMTSFNDITVRDMIELLKTKNQDAVLCSPEFDGEIITYSSLECYGEQSDVDYIDKKGDTKHGDVFFIL